jgi:adenylate/nucleoside-diphosphate kinase
MCINYPIFCYTQEEDPNRSMKKQLGELNYFCPVVLKDKDILWPGNPEIAAKYREKSYYFSSGDAREKFLEDPMIYLPKGKPFKVCVLSGHH